MVRDDIDYLRKIKGRVKAVNVKTGIFGITRDVNPEDDPNLFNYSGNSLLVKMGMRAISWQVGTDDSLHRYTTLP